MADVVVADALTKQFRRPDKTPGVRGAVRHLVRPSFSHVEALRGVSLHVAEGESVAYIGPNGAGKSTTVKLLTGVLAPTSGRVRVCGLDPYTDRTANARNISVVFGQRTQLWWDIAVLESLRLLADIYSVPAASYRSTMEELVDVLDLGPLLAVPARQLSLGQRMRCDLAAALLHSPRVFFLDEPTIGLDVSVKARFRDLVGRMHRERGLTVLLTSHDLGDIEQLCPRVVVIDRGLVAYDGAYARLAAEAGHRRRVVVTLADGLPEGSTVLSDLFAGEGVDVAGAGASWTVRIDDPATTPGAVIARLAAGVALADVRIEEPSAEAVIRQVYEGGVPGAALSATVEQDRGA
ncbi:ATP-binding cassette domain-containing protein [Kineococcus sp. R8]|uniref:ATP-binding cassette domain-containing protein n=1 Tax=Kineococcus siccus TaxID=2696567 RepID=UPI001412E44F|nr:ATP-binding cassette domain-containing protein [Kineococcus siccus]